MTYLDFYAKPKPKSFIGFYLYDAYRENSNHLQESKWIFIYKHTGNHVGSIYWTYITQQRVGFVLACTDIKIQD